MMLRGKITIVIIAIGVLGGFYWLMKNPEVADELPGVDIANTAKAVESKPSEALKVEDETPLTVVINTWGGFAPGIWFNGGLAANKQSRFYKDYGLLVEFKLVDDFQQSREIWKSNQADLLWATLDAFASEASGLKEHHPKDFMLVDFSYGGDVMIGTQDVRTISDVVGHKIAYAPTTPSHTLLIWGLRAGDVDINKIPENDFVKVDLAPQAAEMFKKGQADVAIVWSPDDQDCLARVPGSHVLFSTKTASNIIADIFVAKEAFLSDTKNQAKLKAFCEGWFRASAAINKSETTLQEAAAVLINAFPSSTLDFCVTAIKNARLANYGDNANFFNINGSYSGMTGEALYSRMVDEYTKLGFADANTPSWRSIGDPRIIRSIHMTDPDQRGEGAIAFSPMTEEIRSAPAFANKKLMINFPTGSYALTPEARTVIDRNFVPYAQGFQRARIRVEGFTDDRGSAELNRVLSANRAQSVVDYLVNTYSYDPNRFFAKGNGPDHPLVPNTSDANRAKNRRTEFELLQ